MRFEGFSAIQLAVGMVNLDSSKGGTKLEASRGSATSLFLNPSDVRGNSAVASLDPLAEPWLIMLIVR